MNLLIGIIGFVVFIFSIWFGQKPFGFLGLSILGVYCTLITLESYRNHKLPSKKKRAQLNKLIQAAFRDLVTLSRLELSEQAGDLAKVFQHLSIDMDTWGAMEPERSRERIEAYQNKYPPKNDVEQMDYLSMFNKIYEPR